MWCREWSRLSSSVLTADQTCLVSQSPYYLLCRISFIQNNKASNNFHRSTNANPVFGPWSGLIRWCNIALWDEVRTWLHQPSQLYIISRKFHTEVFRLWTQLFEFVCSTIVHSVSALRWFFYSLAITKVRDFYSGTKRLLTPLLDV